MSGNNVLVKSIDSSSGDLVPNLSTAGAAHVSIQSSVSINNDLTGFNQSDTITLAASTNYDLGYIDWANVAMFTISGIVGGTVTLQLAPDGVTFVSTLPIDMNTGVLAASLNLGDGSYKIDTNGAIVRFAAGAGISAGTLGWNAKISE